MILKLTLQADMNPVIKHLKEKKLVGKRITMSFHDPKIQELWRSFMPHLKEIKNKTGPLLYSLEVYPLHFFDTYDPDRTFEKWAAVEVKDINTLSRDLEPLTLNGGLYAVFKYRGQASQAHTFYQYIFETWLPTSGFVLDDRPHFAVMGGKYQAESPGSEEEIWIPVKSSEL